MGATRHTTKIGNFTNTPLQAPHVVWIFPLHNNPFRFCIHAIVDVKLCFVKNEQHIHINDVCIWSIHKRRCEQENDLMDIHTYSS